jgi:hypothetical protein
MPGGVIGLLAINHFIGLSEYLKGYVGSARDWYDHVYMSSCCREGLLRTKMVYTFERMTLNHVIM